MIFKYDQKCRFNEMIKGLILAVWFTQISLALPALVGRVQDGLKAPVDGARITLWDVRTGKGLQTTSAVGEFSFPGVAEGNYLLKVEKEGKALLYGALRLKGDNPHEVDLVLAEGGVGGAGVVKAEPPLRRPGTSAVSAPQSPPEIQGSRLIHKVAPTYPASARGRISGNVKIWTVLRTDGTLDDLVVLSAPSQDLALAALAAVRQWRYTPTYSDGKAVEVEFTIDVNFSF